VAVCPKLRQTQSLLTSRTEPSTNSPGMESALVLPPVVPVLGDAFSLDEPVSTWTLPDLAEPLQPVAKAMIEMPAARVAKAELLRRWVFMGGKSGAILAAFFFVTDTVKRVHDAG